MHYVVPNLKAIAIFIKNKKCCLLFNKLITCYKEIQAGLLEKIPKSQHYIPYQAINNNGRHKTHNYCNK